MVKFIISQKYIDPDLGPVHITVCSTSRRFVARWRADGIHITVPAHTTPEQYQRVFAELKPRLLQKRPKTEEYNQPGYRFANDLWSFVVEVSKHQRSQTIGIRRVTRTDDCRQFIICVAEDWDFAHPDSAILIRKSAEKIATYITRSHILVEARAIAAELGLSDRVKEWKVGRGQQRLGCCSSKGVVSLSRRLAFLTPELRRHIITHELAHLTHLNHSSDFHALWAEYDGANHATNIRALKKFVFPV